MRFLKEVKKEAISFLRVTELKDIFRLYRGLNDTECALRDWKIKYRKQPDGSINVPGNMDISNRGNRLLPDLSFVTVDGDFNCSNNNLTSLENMPQFIGGAFYCNDNQLTSLKGGPKKVGGVFNCRSNQLRSLDGAPRKFEMLWSDFGIFSCGNEAPEFLCGWSETAGNKALVKKYLPPNPGSR